MKKQLSRICMRMLCSFGQLYAALSRPLFFFCLFLSCAPACLLACLLGWKAMFFPAAMPGFVRWLFLLVWFLFSCAVPALCASAVLAMPGKSVGRYSAVFVPVCTMQLLLAFLWALLLLYRFPPLFCLLTAVMSAAATLLSAGYAFRLCSTIGFLWIASGLWNVLLVFLSSGI